MNESKLPPPRAESGEQRTCILCGHDEWQFINGMCRAPASAPYQHYPCSCKCVFPEPSKGEQGAPERITAGPCSGCGAMVVGLNACPYCGNNWIGTRIAYTRVRSGVTQQSVVESDPESLSGLARQAAEKIHADTYSKHGVSLYIPDLVAIILDATPRAVDAYLKCTSCRWSGKQSQLVLDLCPDCGSSTTFASRGVEAEYERGYRDGATAVADESIRRMQTLASTRDEQKPEDQKLG